MIAETLSTHATSASLTCPSIQITVTMMKTSILTTLLCLSFMSLQAQCNGEKGGWGEGSITGSGPVVKKTLDLDAIESIGLGIAGKVYIYKGSTQKIEVEGQENLINNLCTDVKNKSWNIGFRARNVQYQKGIIIHITIPTVNALAVGGSGSIIAKDKFDNLSELKLSIGGSGDIAIRAEANEVNISLGGSGDVTLEGKGAGLKISSAGSGHVDCSNFECSNAKVSTAGSGDVELWAKEDLVVSSAGSGSVAYKGSPRIKTSNAGSGRVRRMEQ
jgi:hypothetical protein